MALKDSEARVRKRAAEALGRIGPASTAVPGLTAALQRDEDKEVRSEAVRALGKLRLGARAAVPALVEILDEENYPFANCLGQADDRGHVGANVPAWGNPASGKGRRRSPASAASRPRGRTDATHLQVAVPPLVLDDPPSLQCASGGHRRQDWRAPAAELGFIEKGRAPLMNQPIAQAELLLVQPTGDRIDCILQIGSPYRDNDGTWQCPVSLIGWHGDLASGKGVSSFHSLCLAMQFVRSLLLKFVASGGRVLDSKYHKEFSFEAHFGDALSDRSSPGRG